MRKKTSGTQAVTVQALCDAMQRIAPTERAQEWDNVGLLAGDTQGALRRLLLCIDLTEAVLTEAVRTQTDAIVAYHPPVFRPLTSLKRRGSGTDALVFAAIEHRIALYSPHTALDAADGGTNDVLAALTGLIDVEPLEHAAPRTEPECKVVTFIPATHVESVAEAMFAVGAGRIGDYEKCSFRLPGQGTFLGSESTNPVIGQRGRWEVVEEVRLETIVRSSGLPGVLAALRRAHPYEEPAFDVYPLTVKPVAGIGRIGRPPKSTTLGRLARLLKEKTGAPCVQCVGSGNRPVNRVIVVAGSGGDLPFRAGLEPGDVVVTGELRHHDALALERHGAGAVALGHWQSERPVLAHLAARLRELLPGVKVSVSRADADVFHAPSNR